MYRTDGAETLGVYVQVPFCESKCSFCNFSSRVEPPSVYEAYCVSLLEELCLLPEHYARAGIWPELLSLPVDSVYFGGGTPSLLETDLLRGVLRGFHERFACAPAVEFTLEVTPGSAGDEFLCRALELGVNRLSIGAQSFNDRELRSVGRLHSAEDTRHQVQRARAAGIRNVSLDLIAGLPFQTESSWWQSLESALRLSPEHISVYLFEIDEKSRLGQEVLRNGSRYHAGHVPADELMAAAYEKALESLLREGYAHYEISNFARPGFESRHNLKYWRLEPYVGLGAGAHSFDGQRRWSNRTPVDKYQARLAQGETSISDLRRLSPEEQMEEFFFLGLRCREGINLARARERWGPQLTKHWENKITELTRDHWLEKTGDQVRLAGGALLVSNEIFQEFIIA